MFSLKLYQAGILTNKDELNYFQSIFKSIVTPDISCPSRYQSALWQEYLNIPTNNLPDDVMFKSITLSVMLATNIKEFYFQARLFPYLNIEHDCLVYSKECGQIMLNFGVNIIGHYKSVDMKASIIKQAYPRSKSYLITMDEKEAATVNNKIKIGQVLGLDYVIVANHSSFDELIKELQSYTLYKPEPVDVLTSTRFISESSK